MRWVLLSVALAGFVLFDIVMILALCNVLGWTSVSQVLLLVLLCAGVLGLVGGLVGLRWLGSSNFTR